MSEPIQAGDLVQVVRDSPCECGKARSALGEIFSVIKVRMSRDLRCVGCKKPAPVQKIVATSGEMNGRSEMVYELWRLKRIPPLKELEGLRSEDEMDIFDFLDI
jgi:hypothetical protein